MSLCFLSGKVARVLKCLLSQFLGFCGVVSFCLFGFGRFGCVSCFCGSVWFWFCFCLFVLFCFCGWMLLSLFLFFLFCFSAFFGGFKGQVRWPRGSPHLALKPSLFFLFLLFFCLFFFFGGFKGQVRWPKGPPHLALNPPFIFNFLFGFCFLFAFLSLF